MATYGGGTGLATQRECLQMLGCYGAGKVRKLAEIVAEEWVEAHDLYGRNRP